MFDTQKFCNLWIKSLKISIDVVIIHLSKYSYQKFYFPCLQLWSLVSWNVSNHHILEAEKGDNLTFSSNICHLWQYRHMFLLY